MEKNGEFKVGVSKCDDDMRKTAQFDSGDELFVASSEKGKEELKKTIESCTKTQ